MQQVPEIIRRHVIVKALEKEVSPRAVLMAHPLLDRALLLLLFLYLEDPFYAVR